MDRHHMTAQTALCIASCSKKQRHKLHDGPEQNTETKRRKLLTDFADSGARVSSNCFNALRIVRRLSLVPRLIHEANISFLCLKNARQIHLKHIEILIKFLEAIR